MGDSVTTVLAPRRAAIGWGQISDVVLALIVLVLVILEIWVIGNFDMDTRTQVVATLIAPGLAVPVAIRSLVPWPAFVVNAVCTVTMVSLEAASSVYQWANLLMLFTVAASTVRWRPWVALVVSELGVAYFFYSFRDELEPSFGIVISGLWLLVWLFGRIFRSRSEQERLRLDRDLAAELAATRQERLQFEAQRTNMARDLHDLIGHTVNVMVVHAGAGRRAVRTDPDGAERAFETIETTGRSALDELDRVLGMMRSNDQVTPLAPLPDIEGIGELVADVGQTGLDVSFDTAGPTEEISPILGLTVYRVVQEALTNVMNHSNAKTAAVSVSVVGNADVENTVRVTVTDPGPAKPVLASSNGSGKDESRQSRGLSGIVERVQLHGGETNFGPTAAGGFEVACNMPLVRNEVPS